MRATQASKTAGWVAAARAFGQFLPDEARLCTDPYGVRFADPWLRGLHAVSRRNPALARRLILRNGVGRSFIFHMQLRTRFIDDALRSFAASGGRQVVLLGAGYDSRSLRLSQELPGLTYFEVDHPATQAAKRVHLPELIGAPVSFVSWNFQEDAMPLLPDALRAQGHDPAERTLSIWEGVTTYLEPPAIEATVATVAAYSAAASSLVFTYRDRARHLKPDLRGRLTARVVASVGEPFRFGWHPAELPAWLGERGFVLREDRDGTELARRLLPREHQAGLRGEGPHFAIAERV